MDKIFVESKLLKGLKVTHGFFTRNGGCSTGLYHSLNCKFDNGDSKENVEQNLKIVAQYFSLDIYNFTLLKQIHSNRVVRANNSINELEGDGVLADDPGGLIGIVTADCVPILLWDDMNKIAMAIHAGWKGAYSGIIENSISKIKKLGKSKIYAAIGPCIQQRNYEVDEKFRMLFIEQNSENKKYFINADNKGKFLFDLSKYCYDKLHSCGVTNIDDLKMDTYSNTKNFFSCRRAYHNEEKNFGRQISVISPLKFDTSFASKKIIE